MTFEEYWMLFIGAIITTFVGSISSYIKHERSKREEEKKMHDQTIRELVRFVEENTEWRASIEERMKIAMDHVEDNNEKINHLNKGVLALMRNSIIHSCKMLKERGYASIADKDNVSAMYRWYEETGGNGSCKAFCNEVMKLTPVEEYIKRKKDNDGED